MPADLNDYFNKRNGGNGGGRDKKPSFNPEPPQFLKDFGKKAGILYVLIFAVILLVLAKPFVVINSGEVGIKATAGKYDPIPMEPGFHFFIPFIQNIIIIDTKERVINYLSKEDALPTQIGSGIRQSSSISALDARGLVISVDLTVQYKIKPESAPQTIATYGLAWEEKIINPIVRGVVRSVIGNYKAEELPINRNKIESEILVGIQQKIESIASKPVELSTINLREIILPQKIKEQIERVQIAKQEADRAKLEVERAKQEAEKKAALARGEAEARKIQAQGLADAIKIEADAKAYENKEISQSLTDTLLELRQIEVQGKFNDALKENGDAKIFLTPGGSVPNIWIDSKDKQKTTSMSNN